MLAARKEVMGRSAQQQRGDFGGAPVRREGARHRSSRGKAFGEDGDSGAPSMVVGTRMEGVAVGGEKMAITAS